MESRPVDTITNASRDALAAARTALSQRLFEPVDIASLVFFRIAFGSIMLWETWRYYDHGWIGRYFTGKEFYFTYWPFDFVQPWPGDGMFIHFGLMAVFAACIVLGLFYRVSATAFFLMFTYVFLLEQARYLNHYYLVCEAVDYFLDLLRRHTYSHEPIYLADPYFMTRRSDGSADRLYLGIFQTAMGRPLRIICGRQEGSAWWSNYPPGLIGHATVRSFTKNDVSLFHDRYLVTSEQEILISNSISGWDSDGVTFAALPYGVYREEAEVLWAIPLGKHSDGTNVWDVK